MSNILHTVYVSIGSNVQPEKHLQSAVDLLRRRFNVVSISTVYQSPAFGFPDQPDFLDVVVGLTTLLTPIALKGVLETIEAALGRDRASQISPNGPLTLDMDILLWDDEIFIYGDKPWRVPHGNILKYAAIAIPLADCAPSMLHPETKITIKEIAAGLADGTVRKVEFKVV